MADKKYHLTYEKKWKIYVLWNTKNNRAIRSLADFGRMLDRVCSVIDEDYATYDQISVSRKIMASPTMRDLYFNKIGTQFCKRNKLTVLDNIETKLV